MISVKSLGKASPSFWTVHSWLPVEVQRTASLQTSHYPGTWGTFSSIPCGVLQEFTCRNKCLHGTWDLWFLELPLTPCPVSFRTAALLQHLVIFSIQLHLPGPHAQGCVFGWAVTLLRSLAFLYQMELLVLWFQVCNPLPQLNSLLLYLRYRYTSQDHDSFRKLCDLETCFTHSNRNAGPWWLELSLWVEFWVADEPFHLTWVQVICVGLLVKGDVLPKSGPIIYFSQD